MQVDELLNQWKLGLRIAHRAHFETAKYYQRLHLLIGVPTVIISALLGTTVFANLQYSNIGWVKAVLAVLSVTMIVLSSLQAFLRYSERSERHKTAAVQIGELRRELEQRLFFNDKNPINEAVTETLRKKWDSVDLQAPTIPTRIYDRVQSRIEAAESQEDNASTMPAA